MWAAFLYLSVWTLSNVSHKCNHVFALFHHHLIASHVMPSQRQDTLNFPIVQQDWIADEELLLLEVLPLMGGRGMVGAVKAGREGGREGGRE